MRSNYPDGTGPNDPKAPWCQEEPKLEDCDRCDGGIIHILKDDLHIRVKCVECDGTGKIEVDLNEKDEDWGNDGSD